MSLKNKKHRQLPCVCGFLVALMDGL